MNDDTLYQHTDNVITVPITDKETSEVVSAASFTNAQYLLADITGTVKLNYKLNEGIAVEGDNFIITIDDGAIDENFKGAHYHQLVAWNSVGDKLPPLFHNKVVIKPVIKTPE